MPDEWNATRITMERQRLSDWQRDLEEREAALQRGRLAFYTSLEAVMNWPSVKRLAST